MKRLSVVILAHDRVPELQRTLALRCLGWRANGA